MSKVEQKSRDPGIQSGDLVLLRLPKGDIKSVKVDKNTCAHSTLHFRQRDEFEPRTVTIGKFGSFYANELIGQPYGLTYEIAEKKLKYLPPQTLEEIGMRDFTQDRLFRSQFSVAEDTDATNELINDGEFVQPLTVDEIQALKRSGVHASVRNTVSRHFPFKTR